jgi:hypothetical protein
MSPYALESRGNPLCALNEDKYRSSVPDLSAPANFSDEVSMSLTRREVCRFIPALMAAGNAIPAFAAQDDSLPSATFPFGSMPVQDFDHAQMRKILKGKLATGELIEVHATTLPPNGYPHPPHRHLHSEMWLIREGTVELTSNLQSMAPAIAWAQEG